MEKRTLTRRTVLSAAALATTALAAPMIRRGYAATQVVPRGKFILGWHTNIAPRWLDPQQHDGGATPDNFLNALQDAVIKNFRAEKFNHLALADQDNFAEDALSATFRMRDGAKFHDGTPVEATDFVWSFENYPGAWADVLHKKVKSVDILNDHRTVRFTFKSPFLDFPRLMGTSNVCGAAWVVPAKYYQKVGKDGYANKPIGAGPYRLASQVPGSQLNFEAFDDYYRPVHIKNFEMISVEDAATRVAMLERGEADIIYDIPGELVARIKNNPKLMLAPVVSGNFWLEFPGFQDPKNPCHDKRVREAVSFALDRVAINNDESDGKGVVDGNWINDDVLYGMPWPKWPHDVAKAKKLMAQAGYPNGFNVDWLTPAPPYFTEGERIVSQLLGIGIRAKMQTLERAVYAKRRMEGTKGWPGINIIMAGARIGATWANWYESDFKCGGFLSGDAYCVPALDAKYAQYITSANRDERKKLAYEIQTDILENYYFVPVWRHAFMNGIGPRIAAKTWQDVFPTRSTSGYAYPWEDIELKPNAAPEPA
ncbi:MAG: ABC transporter substrate-binding protein [Stellaceae bacterium]